MKNLNSSQLGMNLFQPRRCSTNLCMLCQLRIFFFGSGKGLDKLVMITKIFFSVEQKIKKLHSSFQAKLEKRSEDDDDDEISVRISCTKLYHLPKIG